MRPLLIFDLDGTLIDSALDYTNAVNRLLVEHQHPMLSRQDIIFGLGNGLRALLHKFFPEFRMEDHEFQLLEKKFLDYYEEICLTHAQFYPGALEFLENWDGDLALVTNKNRHPTLKILDHWGWPESRWNVVFTYDSFPEKKPHPRPLLEVLKRTGRLKSEAIMIGDGLPDVMAAQAADISSIACTFGYSKIEDLKKYSPAAYLNSYTELPKLIEALKPG